MKIILIARLKGLGAPGDVLCVKPGFARNYLIPYNFALPANDANLRNLSTMKESAKQKDIDAIKIANKNKDNLLSFLPLVVYRQASPEGKLFGSVLSSHILAVLDSKGIKIPKKSISFPSVIKSLGSHSVSIEFHPDVVLDFEIEVQKES